MSEVRFSARAREDLIDIWLYVATHNADTIADRVCDGIERSCRRLEEHPQLGRARIEIHPEARSLIIERWVVLYRLIEEGVQIARIVDGPRDLTAIGWGSE